MWRVASSTLSRPLVSRSRSLLYERSVCWSSLAAPLDKVLIANRGEIACRVIRTCQRLGIPTVAIYSSADGPDCLHAQMADEAVLIGTGPAPADSYLLQNDVLEISQETGASAIHPGYGFLSENADFCRAVRDAGRIFVGPPVPAITAMGSKSQSKAIMEEAGVPTTPGYYGDETQDVDLLRSKAVEIGFPLLIKAVMGGGGKGMRIVSHESDFEDALASCQRESLAAFGDDRVLLETYLPNPRHVEVQVVADTHGNVVHLFERDCSLQRRHQKIIEEAPASDLSADLRYELGEQGKRAAKAVGYVNAGTVEFLLQGDQFYFCEMNTRLQVEHPISELITGIDLVEWQLRIAAGEPLPLSQDEIFCCGHALEARIYAENPARNFLPATGTVWHHEPPAVINQGVDANGIRVDTGIQAGQEIGVYYDPMISKLIVHDENREQALNKLVQALKDYQIAGVPTNIEFLVKCAEHPTFQTAGAIHTGFLTDHEDDVQVSEHALPPPLAQAVGAFGTMLYLEQRIGVDNGNKTTKPAPWSSHWGSWRMGGASGRAKRELTLDGGAGSVECLCHPDGSFDVRVVKDDDVGDDEEWFHVAGSLDANHKMEVVINHRQRIHLTTVLRAHHGMLQVRMWPERLGDDFFWSVDFENPQEPAVSDAVTASGGPGTVKAPMPGKISRVNAAVGDTVKAGDVVLVMEAMKMEHAIKAPRDGVLAQVRYKANDVVDDGAVLLVLDSDETTEPNAA